MASKRSLLFSFLPLGAMELLLDDGPRLANINVVLRERLGRGDSASGFTRANIDLLFDGLVQS